MQDGADNRQVDVQKENFDWSKGAIPKSSGLRSQESLPLAMPDSSRPLNKMLHSDHKSKLDEIYKLADSPLNIEIPIYEQDDSSTALLRADSLLRATKQQLLDVEIAFEETKSSPRINAVKMTLPTDSSDISSQFKRGVISATVKGNVADYKAHLLTGPLDSRNEKSCQEKYKNDVNVKHGRPYSNERNPIYDDNLGYQSSLQDEMLKTKHNVQKALNTAKGVSIMLSDKNVAGNIMNNGTYIYQEDYFKKNIQTQGIVNSPNAHNPKSILKGQTTALENKFLGTCDHKTMKNKVESTCFCTSCSQNQSLHPVSQSQNETPTSGHKCKTCHKNTLSQGKVLVNKPQSVQQDTCGDHEEMSAVSNYKEHPCETKKSRSYFQGTSPRTDCTHCSCQENKTVSNLQRNSPRKNCNCIKDCACKEMKNISDSQGKSPKKDCNCIKTCACKDKITTFLQGKDLPTNYIKICECEQEKSISKTQEKELKCSCENKCTCGENIHLSKCSNSAMIHLKTCIGGKETPKAAQLSSEGKLIIQSLPSLSIKRNLSVQKIPSIRIPPPGAPPYISATRNVALWGVSHSQIELDLWNCSPSPYGKKSDLEEKQKYDKRERKSSCSYKEVRVYKKKKPRNPTNLVFHTMPAVELGVGICSECNDCPSKMEHCSSCSNKSRYETDKDKPSQVHVLSSEQDEAKCTKCRNPFLLTDLYCGLCKDCCNMSIHDEISRICMSRSSADIKAAACLEQCCDCKMYFPASELFQGLCISCQITKKEVRLYQCDICLNSVPSVEYFEGKCIECYQTPVCGTRSDQTIPSEFTMVHQSLQSMFDGTPFLFDINVAQGINRTVYATKSTCEIRKQHGTFPVCSMSGGKQNEKIRIQTQKEEKNDKLKKKIVRKDERSSTLRKMNKKKKEKKRTKFHDESESKGSTDNSLDDARNNDPLNNGFYKYAVSRTETSKRPASSKSRRSNVYYAVDIDKEIKFEDMNVSNSHTGSERRNLSKQPAHVIQFKENFSVESSRKKSNDRKHNISGSSDSEFEKYISDKSNLLEWQPIRYFNKEERLSYTNIQKFKDSYDVDNDKNSSTTTFQSQSEDHSNILSQSDVQYSSLAAEDVVESEEINSENNIPETVSESKAKFTKNVSDESCNNSETKSSKKEQETQTVDRRTAGSQTISLFTAEVLERRFADKTDTNKLILESLNSKCTIAKSKTSFLSLLEEKHRYQVTSEGNDQQEEDIRKRTGNDKKHENNFMKENSEGNQGNSLASGTDAKIEEVSVGDDKTTITGGDDVYEDDWEEETEKEDSGDKNVDENGTSSDVGATKEVKKSEEDHEDSTFSSSSPKLSKNNDDKLYMKNPATISKTQLKLHTNFNIQTQTSVQNIAGSSKKKTYSDSYAMPVFPCDKVYKKKHNSTQEIIKSTKITENSATGTLKKIPCGKSHPIKHNEGYTVTQVKSDKCTDAYVKQRKVDRQKPCQIQDPSSVLRHDSQDHVNKTKLGEQILPYRKKNMKCSYENICEMKRNVKCPSYQLNNSGENSNDVPCVTDNTAKRTLDASTSPIHVNLTDRETSVTNLMVGILIDRETSPIKTSYLEVSTSPLSLPAMIDEQLSANFPAGNLVDNEMSPITSMEFNYKSSPTRNSIPEKINKETSAICISEHVDSETSEEPVCETSLVNISHKEKLDKCVSTTCIPRNFIDKGTSPIHTLEVLSRSTSVTSTHLPEKVDNTSATSIIGRTVDKDPFCIPSTAAPVPVDVRLQEKINTSLVCKQSECATCKNSATDQATAESSIQNRSHFKTVDTRRKIDKLHVDVQLEQPDEPVDSAISKIKKSARFINLPYMTKQYGEATDSEFSDDESSAVKSLSQKQSTFSEGELPCSCTDEVSVSLTKSTVTNHISTGEVFSCRCFQSHCTFSEGEIARDQHSNVSASQTKDTVQLATSSSVESVWESSEVRTDIKHS